MLWYKAWLETRWRFVIGAVLLVPSIGFSVLMYPEMLRLLATAPTLDVPGELGRRIAEGAELARTYRGYVWAQLFRTNLPELWTLLAVILGTGGLLSQASGGGALFTLSLPVSRERLTAVRAGTVLAELLVLSLVPAVVLPLLSPAVGESFPVGDALVHSLCLFVSGTVFLSLAFLLSTVFGDIWRPLLLACCIGLAVALFEQVAGDLSRHSVFRVMSAELYFRTGAVPWLGLIISAAASAAMFVAASRNLARQDF
jgi:ABC-2 type transport system permease protein